MISSLRQSILLGLLCSLLGTASGCITVSANPGALSWKSWREARQQRALFEDQIPEAPPEPKNPEQVQLAYAQMMENSGRVEEARQHYAGVLEKQPKNVDAWLGQARADQAAGNAEQALAGFQKAVKLAPDSAAAQFGLGQCYASQDQWPKAAESLNKAMLAAPQDSQTRYSLAVALTHIGEIDTALPHFIRTVGDAEAHYNVGLILQEDGRLADAERHFQLAVSKKPELQEAQRWLAHLRGEPLPSLNSAPRPNESRQPGIVPAGHSAALQGQQPPRNQWTGVRS